MKLLLIYGDVNKDDFFFFPNVKSKYGDLAKYIDLHYTVEIQMCSMVSGGQKYCLSVTLNMFD